MLKFFLSFPFIVLLFASSVFSQTDVTKNSGEILRNVKFDVSTPEDVIKQFGKPDSDELDELDAEIIDSWLKIKKNQKVFRRLTYKKIGATEKVLFRFYENKLVKIAFDYKESKDKRVFAADLPKQYNADFVVVQSVLKDTKISDFEGQKENTIPKVRPALYILISVQPEVIYLSIVKNNSFKAFVKSLKGQPSEEIFPGFLMNFQIISRSLVNQ